MRIDGMDLQEAAPGVFYTSREFVTAGADMTAFLKQAADTSPTKRARLCAHPSPDAEQHDMLVVTARGSYVAPHRHLAKSETFLVIEGEADALLFDNNGTLISTVAMGPADTGRTYFYRMPPRQFHGLHVLSNYILFLESTKGPFDPGASEHAPWAPDPSEATAGLRYISYCLAQAS
jgi:cupin fold WbuC family metalloprotein